MSDDKPDSRNRNTKNQAPNTKEIPSSKLQTVARAPSMELGASRSLELGVWCWGPGASLELGVWNLELVAWALSSSRIEMRPTGSHSESALDLGLAACLAFMLMNLSALQVVIRVVVVAGDRAAGPCRA